MSTLISILAITFCILIHELGHLFAALFVNVHVKQLSVGFGPILYGKRIKGIDFTLNAFPLGGYVRFGEDPNSPNYLRNKTPLQRILVSFAGPFLNLALAYLFLLAALFTHIKLDSNILESVYLVFVVSFKFVGLLLSQSTNIFLPHSINDVSSVVGVTKQMSDAYRSGIESFFLLNMGVNISIAIINLIPFPGLLDGGIVVELAMEKWLGKNFTRMLLPYLSMVGVFLLLALFLWTGFLDIKRYF